MKEISEEQIKHGLNEIVKQRPKWPPDPLEFIDLCIGTIHKEEADHARIRKADKQFKLDRDRRLTLGTQEERNEIAKPHLEQLRKLLR